MTASTGVPVGKERRAYAAQPAHYVSLDKEVLVSNEYTDQTTHCHNRRYLQEILESQIAVSRQYKFPLTLVLAEIAHLRQIQFTYGQLTAETILRELARIIRFSVRTTDLPVRYNEDTFAILLLHSNQAGGKVVSERLKAAIAGHNFSGEGGNLMVMLNFGISDQLSYYDQRGHDLIAAAGKALAQAKADGEGSIVRASEIKALD